MGLPHSSAARLLTRQLAEPLCSAQWVSGRAGRGWSGGWIGLGEMRSISHASAALPLHLRIPSLPRPAIGSSEELARWPIPRLARRHAVVALARSGQSGSAAARRLLLAPPERPLPRLERVPGAPP